MFARERAVETLALAQKRRGDLFTNPKILFSKSPRLPVFSGDRV
jgi:hypothetical protein